MYQFIHGSDAAFHDLDQRSRQACVVFANQAMPPGCMPSEARVGFEVDRHDGTACLLVDRNIHYAGDNASVREWLQGGERHFTSFHDLKTWIQNALGPCYPGLESHNSRTADGFAVGCSAVAPVSPGELTDLDAVLSQDTDGERPLYLDEDELFEALSSYVRGQAGALRPLSRRVCRHLARRNPQRPATIFAIGPTGVGKTKTAETLPLALRALDPDNTGYSYLRLDMSEYQERHRVSQLIGAPPGYIGYDDGAQLTQSLVANPRTVVLFDEIEKAHPHILQALMNAMDAGRLSARSGQADRQWIVDCRHAIFLFTTNLDATGILSELEAQGDSDDISTVDRICRRHLRSAGVLPEIVGRVGCFLVFRPLTVEARAEIVALTVARVANEFGLHVANISPDVITHILQMDGGNSFGVRPYEYLVDELLGESFARTAAAGEHEVVAVQSGPPFCCEPLSDLADRERDAQPA